MGKDSESKAGETVRDVGSPMISGTGQERSKVLEEDNVLAKTEGELGQKRQINLFIMYQTVIDDLWKKWKSGCD